MKNKKNIYPSKILNITKIRAYKKKKNEKYMNSSQIKHFKKILLTLYKKLTVKKNKYISKNKENINFADPIDRIVQEEEFTFSLLNKNRETKLINKIKNTIKKIETKNFGYCKFCGIEIGIKRLEVQPTTNSCIDCKILLEIKKNKL